MEQNQIKINNLMIAANTNTVMSAIAYNKQEKLVAYGAANSVLIMDPYHINQSVPKVLFSLKGHTDRVNGVQWLTPNSLVSISADKSLIVWSYILGSDPRDYNNWTYKKIYENAHTESISYLKAFSPNEHEHYFFTMCAAGNLKLWQGSTIETIEYKDQLIFGKNL